MRSLVIAASAAALAVPISFAVPMEEAQAQKRYYRDGQYVGPTWRDDRGRYRCRRPNGTVGLIVGGAAGALIGREIDGGRDRTTGTIVGAAAGALLGREVDRGSRRRCR